MSAVATSVAELGIGDYDGQKKIIAYGTQERQRMIWHAPTGLWLSEPRASFKLKGDWPMSLSAGPGWTYMTGPEGSGGQIAQAGYGWTPQAIHRADAAYAAGLRLYEKLDHLFWVWTSADDLRISTVYFELAPDDVMSTLFTPTAGSHLGTVITGDPGIRRFRTTGWVASTIPTPAKPVLAPHLYVKNFAGALSGNARLEFLTANWRWVGDPTP